MTKGYYEQLCDEISRFIDNGEYLKASEMVEEELKMPYVPSACEQQLLQFREQLKPYLTVDKAAVMLTGEQIAECLKSGDYDKRMKGVNYLREVNIRNHLNLLEDYMTSEEADPLICSELIQIMAHQQISDPVRLKKNGILLEVIPAQLPDVLDQDVLIRIFTAIQKLFEAEDPVFMQQCQSVLINFAFNLYPILLKPQDYEKVLYSVIHYVYRAYDDEQSWKRFAEEHEISENQLINFEL